MATTLKAWPPWPQFIESKGELKRESSRYKQEIIDQYGAEAIYQSWLRTCKSLEDLTAKITAEGTSIIPVMTLDDVLMASEKKKHQLKEMGCFVIRDVVPRSEAAEWFRNLKRYVQENEDEITGMLDLVSIHHSLPTTRPHFE